MCELPLSSTLLYIVQHTVFIAFFDIIHGKQNVQQLNCINHNLTN
jgi:hypothetical protein